MSHGSEVSQSEPVFVGSEGVSELVYDDIAPHDAAWLIDRARFIRPVWDDNVSKSLLPRVENVWRVEGVHNFRWSEGNLVFELEDAGFEDGVRLWGQEMLHAVYAQRERSEVIIRPY